MEVLDCYCFFSAPKILKMMSSKQKKRGKERVRDSNALEVVDCYYYLSTPKNLKMMSSKQKKKGKENLNFVSD